MALHKRSLILNGHRTSLALEPEFWEVLEAIAAGKGASLQAFVSQLDAQRPPETNLASAARLTVLADLKQRAKPFSP